MTTIVRHKLEPTRGADTVHSPAGAPTRVTIAACHSAVSHAQSSCVRLPDGIVEMSFPRKRESSVAARVDAQIRGDIIGSPVSVLQVADRADRTISPTESAKGDGGEEVQAGSWASQVVAMTIRRAVPRGESVERVDALACVKEEGVQCEIS